MKYLLFFVSLLLLINCSAFKPKHYLRDSNSNENIKELYNNVPVIKDSSIFSLIGNLKSIDTHSLPKGYKESGVNTCIPLIDTIGNVESIYFLESMDDKINDLIINCVLNSEFNSNRKRKYSFKLQYCFRKGSPLDPLVNGVYFNKREKVPPLKEWEVQNTEILEKPSGILADPPINKAFSEVGRISNRYLVAFCMIRVWITPAGEVIKAMLWRCNDNTYSTTAEKIAKMCKFLPNQNYYSSVIRVKFAVDEFQIKMLSEGF